MKWWCLLLLVSWLTGCDRPTEAPVEKHLAAPMALPPPVQLHRHKNHVPYEDQFPRSYMHPTEDEERLTEVYNRLAQIRQSLDEKFPEKKPGE
jgi:hypothetical protein